MLLLSDSSLYDILWTNIIPKIILLDITAAVLYKKIVLTQSHISVGEQK